MTAITPHAATNRTPNCLIKRRRARCRTPDTHGALDLRAAQMLLCVGVLMFAPRFSDPAGWTLFGLALGRAATLLIGDYRRAARPATRRSA